MLRHLDIPFKILDRIIRRLNSELERYTPASQLYLATWFDSLWEILEEQKVLGKVIQAAWYQTQEGLKLVEREDSKLIEGLGEKLYDVIIAPLPVVEINNTIYKPIISEITTVVDTSRDQGIELAGWRLDLSLNASNTKANFPDIQFMKMQDLKNKNEVKYEILDQSGRQLTAAEAKFTKMILDEAITKLEENHL